jgi:hypothetical protein
LARTQGGVPHLQEASQMVVVGAVLLTRGCLAVLGSAWFSGDCLGLSCQFCQLGGLQRILNTVLGASTCLLVPCFAQVCAYHQIWGWCIAAFCVCCLLSVCSAHLLLISLRASGPVSSSVCALLCRITQARPTRSQLHAPMPHWHCQGVVHGLSVVACTTHSAHAACLVCVSTCCVEEPLRPQERIGPHCYFDVCLCARTHRHKLCKRHCL